MGYLDKLMPWRKPKRDNYVERPKEKNNRPFPARIIGGHRKVDIRKVITHVAVSFVGQEEIPGNMGFKTAWFYKKMVAVGFKKTHPWCAYFDELVWKEAYKKAGLNRFRKLDKLFSASVLRTLHNFKKAGYPLKTNPDVGDLIVWQSGTSYRGHIGIVVGVSKNNRYVYTVEGNTNKDGGREGLVVAKKKRRNVIEPKRRGLHIRGYISPIK